MLGSQMGAVARLLLIADFLKETSVQQVLLVKLKSRLEGLLRGRFIYDSSWGGVFDEDSLDSVGTGSMALYFNHLYTYGYFVYAAAVVASFEPAWLNRWKSQLAYMVRDYANMYEYDQFFPFARHKDFYAGHSWGSGLSTMVDGVYTESVSLSGEPPEALLLPCGCMDIRCVLTNKACMLASHNHHAALEQQQYHQHGTHASVSRSLGDC